MKTKIIISVSIFIVLILSSILYYNFNLLVENKILLIENKINYLQFLFITIILLISSMFINIEKQVKEINKIKKLFFVIIIIPISSILIYFIWNTLYNYKILSETLSFKTSITFSTLMVITMFIIKNRKEILNFFKKAKSTD